MVINVNVTHSKLPTRVEAERFCLLSCLEKKGNNRAKKVFRAPLT